MGMLTTTQATHLEFCIRESAMHTRGAWGVFKIFVITYRRELVAEGVQAYYLKLNSSTGYITAKNLTAHYLYLVGAEEGSTVESDALTLYSGDNVRRHPLPSPPSVACHAPVLVGGGGETIKGC